MVVTVTRSCHGVNLSAVHSCHVEVYVTVPGHQADAGHGCEAPIARPHAGHLRSDPKTHVKEWLVHGNTRHALTASVLRPTLMDATLCRGYCTLALAQGYCGFSACVLGTGLTFSGAGCTSATSGHLLKLAVQVRKMNVGEGGKR